MEKQYCKVGAVTPITTGHHAIALLEHHYQNFIEKASLIQYSNTKLGEFFELKALKIKRILNSLG